MIVGQKIGATSRKLGKKSFNLLKKGVKLTGAIGLGYGMAKVHSALTDEGDAPEPAPKERAAPGESIEDIFSGPLGSGNFEERPRSRRQAISNIEPLPESTAFSSNPLADSDGFPILRFRE